MEEIELLKTEQTLISALHVATVKESYLKALKAKRITAICYEYLKDEGGIFPVVRSMSEITGNTAILIAAEYLSNLKNGKGMMLGGVPGIPPCEVVILGAGTVSAFAARAALGLGAEVKQIGRAARRLNSSH